MKRAVLALVLVAACKPGSKPPPDAAPRAEKPPRKACSPAYAAHLCRGGDALACGMTGGIDDDSDAALLALFPGIGAKTIVDGHLARPAPATFTFESSPPYTVTFPIDWAADPYGDRSWRSSFQNLSWIYAYYAKQTTDLDTAGYVVVDWAERALAAAPALEWTWRDAPMARRLERVGGFLDRYLADRDVLDRRVLVAAARVISSHLHAMSLDACYTDDSNHGMMQDLAVVRYARRFPALPDAPAIGVLARDRLIAHVVSSVTPEGIHVENSPEYQVLYLRLVIDAIDGFRELGEVPPELEAARDGMLASLVHLLQPNLTLPQFGDSTNNGPKRIQESVEAARAQGSTSPALDELTWLLSGTGTPPAARQHVFAASGYAAFRSSWSGPDAVAAHFRCGRLGDVHVHADDTTFELYGHGTELVVDTGKYSYAYDDPLVMHQYDVRAHNVLVVDGAPFDEHPVAKIVAHSDGWVRGEHGGYASRGVSVTRTFGFAGPDTVALADVATADEAHTYAQHFHLHPTLSDVKIVDARTVIARGPGGAAVTITAGETPVRIDVVRGQNDATGVQGWYFPGWQGAEPTADVIFDYGTRPGAATFPAVLTASSKPATAVRADGDTISWSRGGKPRSLTAAGP